MKLSPVPKPFAPAHNGYKLCIDNGTDTRNTLYDKSRAHPDDFLKPRKNTEQLSSGTNSTSRRGESGPEKNSADNVSGPVPVVFERRKNQLPAQFEAQVREFQALAQNLLEMREHEQQVISRELHDNIAQVLSAATARITLARQEPIPAWLRQELLDLRDQLKAALADVRTLARELRPSVLDHLGFAAALEKHAEAFRQRTRMTLEVTVVPEAADFLEHGDLTHLFRLTQEALNNIEEHSGAKKAWIGLWENDGAMQLEIGDDGCAFTPERVAEAQRDGHLGLLGMRERAELLGGTFLLEAVPGQGTVIRITIPPPPRKTRVANAIDQPL